MEEPEEFKDIISRFQKQSEALVIDQLGNPGGIVLYMYAIASMLTDKPLALHAERETISQQDVYNAVMTLDSIKLMEPTTDEEAQMLFGIDSLLGYPVTLKLFHQIVAKSQFIIDEWNKGNHFTSLNYMMGISSIDPHPQVRYTKPILILVNELDVSCGDFFPAIMQDNKRATIFGSKTAGAGGYVLNASHHNMFGISTYTFTGSIAERLNQQPIENLGVTPDVSYTLTKEDLQNNYPSYIQAVNKTIEGMLPKRR
jgi:C-terminal processing protease CtpA/Prc